MGGGDIGIAEKKPLKKKMILSGEILTGVPFPREWEGLSCAWPDPGLSGGSLMVLCPA